MEENKFLFCNSKKEVVVLLLIHIQNIKKTLNVKQKSFTFCNKEQKVYPLNIISARLLHTHARAHTYQAIEHDLPAFL